jgi:hypothetical protein
VPLRAHNGRVALVDAYQEALDLAVYLRQEVAERESLVDELARVKVENTRLRERVETALAQGSAHEQEIRKLAHDYRQLEAQQVPLRTVEAERDEVARRADLALKTLRAVAGTLGLRWGFIAYADVERGVTKVVAERGDARRQLEEARAALPRFAEREIVELLGDLDTLRGEALRALARGANDVTLDEARPIEQYAEEPSPTLVEELRAQVAAGAWGTCAAALAVLLARREGIERARTAREDRPVPGGGSRSTYDPLALTAEQAARARRARWADEGTHVRTQGSALETAERAALRAVREHLPRAMNLMDHDPPRREPSALELRVHEACSVGDDWTNVARVLALAALLLARRADEGTHVPQPVLADPPRCGTCVSYADDLVNPRTNDVGAGCSTTRRLVAGPAALPLGDCPGHVPRARGGL